MKFFTLIDEKKSLHLKENQKIIPKDEFSSLLSAAEIIEEIRKDEVQFKQDLEQEAEEIRKKSEEAGFQSGLEKWNEQLIALEKDYQLARDELANSIVPLAMTAVKKIIGKELKQRPDTVIDIVTTALRPVSQHRKIMIYVSKQDYDLIEEHRARLREIFEHLESLSISVREDVAQGGCIIETEAGIINAQLDNQMNALEGAFETFFKNKGNA